MSLSWKHLFAAVFTLCFVACSNQQNETLEIVEEPDVWKADTAVQEVREQETHQMPEGWCGGRVLVEGGESVPEGTEVVVVGDGDTLRLKVDYQGRYGFVPAQTGSHTCAVEVAGFYPDQGAVSLFVGEESDLPTLTLRRWKVLQEAPGLRLGESLLDGRVFTFWTEVDALQEEGKLWLYLVEEDETILLHESASSATRLVREVEGTSLILFTTDVNEVDRLANIHVFDTESRQELAVVQDAFYERLSTIAIYSDSSTDYAWQFLVHDGLMLQTSGTGAWVNANNEIPTWLDLHTLKIHAFEKGSRPNIFARNGDFLALMWGNDPLKARYAIVEMDLSSDQSKFVITNAYMLDEPLLDGFLVGEWGPSDDMDGPLYYWAGPGHGRVLLEELFLHGQLEVSKDGGAVATVAGGGMLSDAYEPIWAPLHLLELGAVQEAVEVSQEVMSGSLHFSADSRWLLFTQRQEEEGWKLIRYDRQNGEQLALGGDASDAMFRGIDPTSRYVAFTKEAKDSWGEGMELWLHTLASGEERLVAEAAWGTGVSFSPDGEYIVYEYVVPEVIDGIMYMNSYMAVTATVGEGLGTPAVECRGYLSAPACRWSPDSTDVLCLCDTSFPQHSMGTLTLLRPGTGETAALSESEWWWSVKYGPQGGLLATPRLPEPDSSLVWYSAPTSLKDGAMKTWKGATWHYVTDQEEPAPLAWIGPKEGGSLLLALATGIEWTLPGPASLTTVFQGDWRLVTIEVPGEWPGQLSTQSGLLVNQQTGASMALPGTAYGTPDWPGRESAYLVWPGRLGAWGSGDIVISGFDAASGQLWTLAQGDYGYLMKSPGDRCMAALDLGSGGDSAGAGEGSPYPAGTWVGACLEPGKAAVYLAANVAVAPGTIPQGALVYGCQPEGDAEATALCVARIP